MTKHWSAQGTPAIMTTPSNKAFSHTVLWCNFSQICCVNGTQKSSKVLVKKVKVN
ncbi:hypothetical protein BDF20DRAFT_207110 [Mycotypha africana]|uniref:uncharacterized protein n=1 Tax=Mycotypha africana TaxID=64632 RepID=UPI0023004285|nr:uncharacterized protein BDF20DRAFT_207110 [Mycotypha africana]KAI8967694.1 hypothetical protein BDF20DRAFT_207110 [Mycotypha africana]